MPLKTGYSKKTISSNISELHEANKSKPSNKKRSNDQIVAIAYSQARRSK